MVSYSVFCCLFRKSIQKNLVGYNIGRNTTKTYLYMQLIHYSTIQDVFLQPWYKQRDYPPLPISGQHWQLVCCDSYFLFLEAGFEESPGNAASATKTMTTSRWRETNPAHLTPGEIESTNYTGNLLFLLKRQDEDWNLKLEVNMGMQTGLSCHV